MNKEEQKIAIAIACGYKQEKYIDTFEGGSGRIRWKDPKGEWVGHYSDAAQIFHLPDYLNDLNAMHEAEKTLNDEQRKVYTAHLHPKILHHYLEADFLVCHATATQRAEAFLRTLNLWKE